MIPQGIDSVATLLACATCTADRGSATNIASTAAIGFMLLLLVVVLGGIIRFMRYLSRCERRGIAGGPNP